jgi:hypothetical protein
MPATEGWRLEHDNDPMPGRAWDTPLVGGTAELILDNALGAAVVAPTDSGIAGEAGIGKNRWPRR